MATEAREMSRCKTFIQLFQTNTLVDHKKRTFFVMVNKTSCDTIQINSGSNRVSKEINHLITPESVYDTRSCCP